MRGRFELKYTVWQVLLLVPDDIFSFQTTMHQCMGRWLSKVSYRLVNCKIDNMGCGASRGTAEGGGISKCSRPAHHSILQVETYMWSGRMLVQRSQNMKKSCSKVKKIELCIWHWLWHALFKIYLPIEYLRWSLARGDRQSAGQAESSSDQGGGGDGILRSKAAKNEQPRL